MGNDLSSIINLGGHQSIAIATTPIKIIVEKTSVSADDDISQPLISALSLNPTKQYWSELCHHLITYDYPTSYNTRLLNLLKDIYPSARLTTYKLRFHNGYCTIVKPKWSSNYDIDIPRLDNYVDVNVSFCDINNQKRFGPYDIIANSLLRGMDSNSTPEEQAARLRRPRVTLEIVKLYGMENNEVDIDCTPYPIYKELTKVLYVTERDEYQGYCEDIQVKDALIDGDVMEYKRLFPKICKEQQVKRVDVSEGNNIEIKEVDTEELDAGDEKPKAQDMASTKKDESSSSSDSSDSSESESEDEEETNQSMAKKNEPQKEKTSLVNEKVTVNKDESSSSSSDSDSESEDEKKEAKQSSKNDASSSSSSDSDSSDSSDSEEEEEEEEVNVKDKQSSKEATRKEDDKALAKNQDESSSSSSSSSDSSDSEDETSVPTKKDSSPKTVPKASSPKRAAPTANISPQKKKLTQSNQSNPDNKRPAEPKEPSDSLQVDTKPPAKSKNKRKREQNATKQALAESEKGDKSSPNNAGDQPKKKRKANIMTGRYAREIAAAKSAAAKSSTANSNKKKSTTSKKKPDPNEPRRPKNGFYLFCDSVRAQMTAQNPDLPPKDIQVLMRKEYKSLSKSQLTAWKEVAKQAHEQYRIELEAYEKTLKKDD